MSILYKKRKITNKKNEKVGYTYGVAYILDVISTKQLAEEISHSTTVTRADVLAVLTEASVAIKNHLLNSQGVKLDELGTFKPALRTKAVLEDEKTKFGVNNIIGTRINYQPTTYFTPDGGTGAKGGRTGFRTKELLQGATFKLYGSSESASSSSSSSSTTNP